MTTPSKDEESLQKALEFYLSEKRQTPDVKVLKIARRFNVDYQRLQRRVHGVGARSTRKGPGRLLTDAQEATLIEHINNYCQPGTQPTPQMIKAAANAILASAHTDTSSPPPVVSKMWPYRFMSSRKQFFKNRSFEEFRRGEVEDAHPLTTSSVGLPTQLRRWTLRGRTSVAGDKPTFAVDISETPQLKPGQVLLKTLYLGNNSDIQRQVAPLPKFQHPYTPFTQLGDTIEVMGIARVIASRSPHVPVDSIVTGPTGWTNYSVHDTKNVSVVEPIPDLPGTHFLGAFGLPGFTAYYVLTEIVKATRKDAIVVSDAAGPVGKIVVQVAKKMIGCRRVIGIAESEEICRFVEILGADVCVDYAASSFNEELAKETEGFVEIYFETDGGNTLDVMLTRLAKFGRVAAVSTSHPCFGSDNTGLRNFSEVVYRRLQIFGFLSTDSIDRLPEVRGILVEAWRRGTLRVEDSGKEQKVVDVNFDDIPKTWTKLVEGANKRTGDVIIKLKD
ncbi:hypothetical protein BJX63DRAFT_387422 [Aspergillus granulosus]|uniref:Uncharacterized protein n=1 Tax=Aspergillus granulosus TaxID=176169 RepID=A0ABR4HP20_9EURO